MTDAANSSNTKFVARFGTFFLAILFLQLHAQAVNAEITLICENPRREYIVIYEPGTPYLLLNPDSEETRYVIEVDDNRDGSHVVTTLTVEGGPTARLHLRPYQKMEYWDGGQLIQTDGCYLSE